MTIDDLLAASRTAHQTYRRNLPRKQNVRGEIVTLSGDPVAAREALELAGTLRKQAEDADPTFEAAAWATDEAVMGVHHKVLTFYAEEAAKPTPSQQAFDRRATEEKDLPDVKN